jgi:ribosomal protein S18 acetylase RimI-like enzyme
MIIYRNIALSDHQDIEEFDLRQDDHGEIFAKDELDEIFTRENSFVVYQAFVAVDGEAIVGYILCMVPKEYPKQRHILRCVVDKDYRRQGIGSELISRLEPQEVGHKVTIEVAHEEYSELAFLRTNGYVITSMVEDEYSEEGELEMEGYFILTNEKKPAMKLAQRLAWRVN